MNKIRSILLLIGAYMLFPIILRPKHAVQTVSPELYLSAPCETMHAHFMLLSLDHEHPEKAGIAFINGNISAQSSKAMTNRLKMLLDLFENAISTDNCVVAPVLKSSCISNTLRFSAPWAPNICRPETSFQRGLLTFKDIKAFYKEQMPDCVAWQYIVLMGLVIIAWLIHKIMFLFFKFIAYKFIRIFHNDLAIERLLSILMAIFFLRIMLITFPLQCLEPFISQVLAAIICFMLMCLAYKCVNIIRKRIIITKQHDKFIIHILPLYSIIAKVIIILVGLAIMMDNLGFSTGSLVQAFSFSTLGLSLASQDTIKNLFGSLMIVMDKPFSVGDEIVTGATRGKVEEIGLRATLLRTKEGSLVYIPNAKLVDAHIDNFGRRTLRLVSLELPLSYGVALELLPKFINGLQAIAQCQPFVSPENTSVYFDRMNENGFIIIFNLYLNTPEGKLEQECKNTVIPLILKLANDLELRLGKVSPIVHIKEPPHSVLVKPPCL